MIRLREQGFTLLELMVVVFITALILTVSYPSLSRGSSALHLRAAGRDVLNTFRFARERAITEQAGIQIIVDKEKQQLILSNAFGEKMRTYILPHDVRIQRMALANNEIFVDSLAIRFLPNGSSENAKVLLRSDTGSLLRIVSDPLSGGARIESDQEKPSVIISR
jgi:prepilin-type N-terminal cleavage/methylation domain-containing protein